MSYVLRGVAFRSAIVACSSDEACENHAPDILDLQVAAGDNVILVGFRDQLILGELLRGNGMPGCRDETIEGSAPVACCGPPAEYNSTYRRCIASLIIIATRGLQPQGGEHKGVLVAHLQVTTQHAL